MQYALKVRTMVPKSDGSIGTEEGYDSKFLDRGKLKSISEYLTLKQGVTSHTRSFYGMSGQRDFPVLTTMEKLTSEQISAVSNEFSKTHNNINFPELTTEAYILELDPINHDNL